MRRGLAARHPGDPIEVAVVAHDLLNASLLHRRQVYGVSGRQVGMGLDQRPRTSDGRLVNREHGEGQGQDPAEDRSGILEATDRPVAVDHLLQQLGVGRMRSELAEGHLLQVARTGLLLRACDPGRVHEDVGVEEDHLYRSSKDSRIIWARGGVGRFMAQSSRTASWGVTGASTLT